MRVCVYCGNGTIRQDWRQSVQQFECQKKTNIFCLLSFLLVIWQWETISKVIQPLQNPFYKSTAACVFVCIVAMGLLGEIGVKAFNNLSAGRKRLSSSFFLLPLSILLGVLLSWVIPVPQGTSIIIVEFSNQSTFGHAFRISFMFA